MFSMNDKIQCYLGQRLLFNIHYKLNVLLRAIAIVCIFATTYQLCASNSVIVGTVRVQLLSGSLVRLESEGAEGFEDRNTFHVVNRNWPGTSYTSNLLFSEVVVTTAHYVVHVPQGATSLSG